MMKRLTILCLSAFVLASMFGCEPKARYRVMCFLFDGVPPPPGVAPCDDTDFRYLASRAESSPLSNGQDVAREYTQHGPYAARLCEGCHQRQSNNLLMAKEDLCFNCHDLSIKKRNIHGPVASGSCVVCHDPHGSGNKYLLVAKSQDFCLHCHTKEDILKTDAHQNMDAGCTTCHNAHASDNDFLLISLAAERYKAKRDTPPRANLPRKERASGGITQGQPATSSVFGPEKRRKTFPTSSGTPPPAPGADLKQKHISKRAPAAQGTERQVELVEAKRER